METTHRRLAILSIVLSQSSQAVALAGIALFLPLIRRDIHLSFSQAGSLAAASTLTYALMQIPSGALADRWGPKRIFITGQIGTTALMLTFAQLNDYWLLIANQAASGVFRALMFAPGLVMIASYFSESRHATALGLYVAGGVSSNIALNLLGPLLLYGLSWRQIFVAFALASLLTALSLALFVRDRRRAAPTDATQIRRLLELFRNRAMVLIAGVQFIRLAIASSITFWLPTMIVVEKHYSLATAGLAVALAAGVTAPSNFLGGYLSDRMRNPLMVIGGSIAVLAITTSLFAIVQNLGWLLLVIAINALVVQLYFGPLFAMPMSIFGRKDSGLISGAGNFFANLGGFVFVYAFGVIRDANHSFAPALFALSGLALCGVALTLAARPLQQVDSVG